MTYKIGYSFWGFLGNGIVDTPDGGRFHRYDFLKEIVKNGFEIILLQKNRDLIETGQDFSKNSISFNLSFPKIDILILEYRWPILNRNFGISKIDQKYTPDLHRQDDLIDYYCSKDVPIIIWDKDLKLNNVHDIKKLKVLEPTFFPKEGRKQLLFPLHQKHKNIFLENLKSYNSINRMYDLIYMGNQYERDESFMEFIDNSSGYNNKKAIVYGNWKYHPFIFEKIANPFQHCEFRGRIGFEEIDSAYKKSLCTVLIAPELYYNRGLYTQRIFESIINCCIPLCPKKYMLCEKIIIPEFLVKNSKETADRMLQFRNYDNKKIAELINKQYQRLKYFDMNKQVKNLISIIMDLLHK
ncbi:MAG: hypothetical protein K2X94_04700 [Amoebophilaceae bacterium]|nr:hypothetical protein [Amoebophilaceae bacterium]